MKGLAWLALIVAIIALILGWVAFNRSGQDLEAIVEREVEEALNELQAGMDEVEEETEEEVAEEVTEETETQE